MRAHTSFYSLLTAAALSAAAATPAAAQQTITPVRLVASTAIVAEPRSGTRTLATYDFDSSLPGMPSRVTVADSAGIMVASYRPRGTGIEQPMKVAVVDRDILLEAETVRGTLTMALYDQNDPKAAGAIIGTWKLGSIQGELRARAVR
jgi:hypothetical protein